MGTCCQAGERNAEGKADPPSCGFGATRSEGQRTEARSRRTEGNLLGFCAQRVVCFLRPCADDFVQTILTN